MRITSDLGKFGIFQKFVLNLVGHKAFVVYAALTTFSNVDSDCWPSIKTLGETVGMSESAVKRGLTELELKDVITVRPRFRSDGSHTSNHYHINVVPEPDGVGPKVNPGGSENELLTRPANKTTGNYMKGTEPEGRRSRTNRPCSPHDDPANVSLMKNRFDELTELLEDVTHSSSPDAIVQVASRSPVREDQHASFSIGLDRKTLNITFSDHGFQGSQQELFKEVVKWSKKQPAFFFPPRSGEGTTTFTYTDARGNPLCRKIKKPSEKKFKWQSWTGDGWKYGKPKDTPLYNLREVLVAIERCETVYVVEGERDCHSAAKMGLVATTPPDGAGSWRDRDTAVLKGATVVVIADNDEAGIRHARQIEHALNYKCRIVLPGVGKDLTDHHNQGLAVADLVPA